MTRPATEMERRVAEAINAVFGPTPLDQVNEIGRENIWAMARAAIRAMRGPTMEMVEAGADTPGCGPSVSDPYNAMIDTASPPDAEGE